MKVLLNLVKSKKIHLIFSMLLSALASLLAIVPYIFIYYIIDVFIKKGLSTSFNEIIYYVSWAAAALVLRYVLLISAFVFSHIAAFDLLYEIRLKLLKHLGKLSMGYWSKSNSGKTRKIIHEDVELLENFIAHQLPDAVNALILPIATIAYLFFEHWALALVTLIPILIGAFLVKMMWGGSGSGSSKKELMAEYSKSLEAMHSTSVEFVRGMPVVKAFNITAKSFLRLKNAVMLYKKLVIKWSKAMGPYWAIFSGIILGGGIFIFPLGFYFLSQGSVSVSTLLLFILLGTGCFNGYAQLVSIVAHMEFPIEAASRIQSILGERVLFEPTFPEKPDNFSIEIKNLNFKYEDEGGETLKNINAFFPEGSFTALVGPSGAGKTTLVNLIARMWESEHPSIYIGEKSLQQLGTEGINAYVGTIFQDVQMLTDTVASNIRMSSTKASIEQVISASKVAYSHAFIEQLPKKYETVIGDGGEHHLSGGEKQRIALSRVILKNPPIILLDEATSYTDAESETLIQNAFSKLMLGKTVIVIAHRLSTIVKADNIIVMDKGEIVEQGKHEELLKNEALYSKMWQAHNRARTWNIGQGGFTHA